MEESKYCIGNTSKTSDRVHVLNSQNSSLNRIASLKRKQPSINKNHHTICGNDEDKSTSRTVQLLKKKRLICQKQYLPVYFCKQQIIEEFKKSDILLLMGETGSGKTTQIPQYLLDYGYAEKGLIGITQPRRVAAITVAKRVSQEIGCQLGEKVGYSVRFEDCTSPKTLIKFLTDGSLLREALRDRLLLQYKVLILDEAHERSINTDVLFGIVKTAQTLRFQKGHEPLKLIVTSATMDIDNFSRYFGVQGMYLEGRLHSIRVMHTKTCQSDYLNTALVTLFDFHRNTPINEDVLIFLTGQEEIEIMAQQIRHIVKANSDLPGVRVFPLYAQLPQNKQLECFLPSSSNSRKIILATNIAETSITIPGIRCVIDCGFVKRRNYNCTIGLEVLRAVRISQAEAWQRCGRAGRDAPGTCYRTYTKTEMKSFESIVKPEILRSNISSVILSLLALGIDCRNFDFLDPPPLEAVQNAYHSLLSLGAITSEKNPKLTSLGFQMAQFPLDPRFSKIILSAPSFGCMEEILSLVSLLSSENIFVCSPGLRETANLIHAKFFSKHGDLLTLLNVYNTFQKTQKIKLWCHDNFLNIRNLLYAREVRKQLVEISKRLNLKFNTCGTNYESVKKCLLTGLFDNIAELEHDNMYLTISTRQHAKIHPSSVYFNSYKPKYIIFIDILLTDRNYLRQITDISPNWISEILPNFKHISKIKT